MANSSDLVGHISANSSDSPSSNRDSATTAGSSGVASINCKRPTEANPNTSNQERPTMSSTSYKEASWENLNSSEQASCKRARIENVSITEDDRITSLPVELCTRILEHLPLQTAIKLSQLSILWYRKWQRMSKLSFDQSSHPRFREDFSAFSSFVDTVLLLCDSNSVRSISITFSCSEKDYHSKLPIWLRFVTSHNVEELEVDCCDGILELPLAFSHNFTIQKMKLSCSEIKLPFPTRGPYLRWLSKMILDHVYFPDDDLFHKILHGCPVLEELELVFCEGVIVYDFYHAVRLKKFSFIYDLTEFEVGIQCCDLEYILISCSFQTRTYYLHNQWSLREVVLDGDEYDSRIERPVDNNAQDIIASFSHVEKLTLRHGCLELFAFNYDRSFPGPFSNVKSSPSPLPSLRILVLTVHFSELVMIGLAYMLRSFPNLETLIIDLDDSYWWMCGGEFIDNADPQPESMETYWNSQDIEAFKCLPKSLKTVKITRYGLQDCEDDNLVQFLEFILKHALMLEELSVVCLKSGDGKAEAKEQLATLAQTLLGFERSSPFVKMVFS